MPLRRLLPTAVLLVLPVAIAAFGLDTLTAVLLVLAMLAWYWLTALGRLRRSAQGPALTLDTIGVSHFVEKVRWCLDRLGADYVERPSVATLGAFFAGRTVPRLRVRTGAVESSIGNSPEILRYLWGAYGAEPGDRARFLEPTAERLQLERDLDRYAANLRVWVYHHLLADRALTLHAWGADSRALPAWQRAALRVLYPLLAALVRRTFRVDDEHYGKAVSRIEELLGQVETRLADGRRSILGGADINYTDLAFAAFTGLWLQPAAYAAGKAEDCRIVPDRMPAAMRSDVGRWTEDHPKAARFVEALYAERQPKPAESTGTRN